VSDHFFAGSYGGDARKVAEGARLECRICSHVYDPAEGDEQGQIPPGTPFAHLPDGWRCPVCDAPKDGFLVLEGADG
jgi:rubredoxin